MEILNYYNSKGEEIKTDDWSNFLKIQDEITAIRIEDSSDEPFDDRDWYYIKEHLKNVEKIFLNGYYPSTEFECFDNLKEIIVVDVDKINSIQNCEKLEKVTFLSHTIVDDKTFINCPNLSIINFSDTMQQISNPFENCKNIKEINYKGINLFDTYPSLNFYDINTFHFIYNVIKTDKLSDYLKSESLFMCGGNNLTGLFDFLLHSGKEAEEFLNDAYDNQLGWFLIQNLDKSLINSKEFKDFMENKTIMPEIFYIGDSPLYKILDENMILSCFKPGFILSHIDLFDDTIKFNKNFLIKLFNQIKNERACCDDFLNTLYHFRDNETIVGKFASVLNNNFFATDDDINMFMNIIDWPISDFDKMCWLITNNSKFFKFLHREDQEKYILYACASLEGYETNEAYTEIYSPEYKITFCKEYFRMSNDKTIIEFNLSDNMYNQILDILEDYKNEKKNEIEK